MTKEAGNTGESRETGVTVKLSLQYLRYLPISQKSNSSIFHLMPLVRKCNVVYEIVNVISAAGHQKSHSLRVK